MIKLKPLPPWLRHIHLTLIITLDVNTTLKPPGITSKVAWLSNTQILLMPYAF
jgi:hypothetical protein